MKIAIIDHDPTSKTAIRAALQSQNLLERCDLVETTAQAEHASICLWVGENAPPEALSIKESDQFTWPFRIGRLLDRVRKYAETKQIEPIAIGPYALDSAHNTLNSADKASIRLTDKEAHMLSFMAQHKGSSVDRQTLLDEVWGYAKNVETHTLETHIYRLRQKIEQDPSKPNLLITDDQGYRLVL